MPTQNRPSNILRQRKPHAFEIHSDILCTYMCVFAIIIIIIFRWFPSNYFIITLDLFHIYKIYGFFFRRYISHFAYTYVCMYVWSTFSFSVYCYISWTHTHTVCNVHVSSSGCYRFFFWNWITIFLYHFILRWLCVLRMYMFWLCLYIHITHSTIYHSEWTTLIK